MSRCLVSGKWGFVRRKGEFVSMSLVSGEWEFVRATCQLKLIRVIMRFGQLEYQGESCHVNYISVWVEILLLVCL